MDYIVQNAEPPNTERVRASTVPAKATEFVVMLLRTCGASISLEGGEVWRAPSALTLVN